MKSQKITQITHLTLGDDTKRIEYIPNEIDEYLVIVNDVLDWEEIHQYIVNENEIDGIPNRKIECANFREYSLRSSVYLMSVEESELLKKHPKIETVFLNPEKYPQPRSLFTSRYKKNVAFNKPSLPLARDNETISHTNGVRSNWSHLFVTNPTSKPFKGVGITTTTIVNTDVQYSLSGKNVDAVIIDEGIGAVHPEFLKEDGTRRVKDLILDGPYKIDPSYFISNNLTYTKIFDNVNFGVGIASTAAREWWTNPTKRSSQFQSLGSISSINSLYTIGHALSKTTNSDGNQITGGHGTACASQIGGKSFGLAFDCNLWNIRINFGDGYIDASVALDICTIFHNAKKISQNNNPDPTIVNNSYGITLSTGNASGTTYTHGYRGTTLTYIGNNSNITVPANSGSCRNTKSFTYNASGTSITSNYTGSGQYNGALLFEEGLADNSSAENAIASGCIIVSSAGNTNQKLCDYIDIDYNNWFATSTNYINRVGGVQKGFSGLDVKGSGSIRVGALDCAVEPSDSKQGSTPFSIRKSAYSANGPMIDIWAPAEMTMAAGYAGTDEDYVRSDDSNFYDTWFNGTSAACPNTCSLIALYLESNRSAYQQDVREWLNRHGSVEIDLSDPYPDPSQTGYWSQSFNSSFDSASLINDSYNVRGNGNLRGAPKKVLFNPFANNTIFSINNLEISGISLTQS